MHVMGMSCTRNISVGCLVSMGRRKASDEGILDASNEDIISLPFDHSAAALLSPSQPTTASY